MEHSVNILLGICWNTFIDYFSCVLWFVVSRKITLFAQRWSKFFQNFQREQSMKTVFQSPKEERDKKIMLGLNGFAFF